MEEELNRTIPGKIKINIDPNPNLVPNLVNLYPIPDPNPTNPDPNSTDERRQVPPRFGLKRLKK